MTKIDVYVHGPIFCIFLIKCLLLQDFLFSFFFFLFSFLIYLIYLFSSILFLFSSYYSWTEGILSISTILHEESDDDDNNYNNSKNDNDNDDENENDFNQNYIEGVIDCKWFPNVDFVVENGARGLIVDEITESPKSGRKRVSILGGLSTIVDLTTGRPVILRQGKGYLDVDSIQT